MTLIHIDLRGADDTPVTSGSILFSPTRRLHIDDPVDDHIILPVPFRVELVLGEADVELMPTEDNVWAWSVIERTNKGIRRTVVVPESIIPGEVLDYGDLEDVDPETLQPYNPTSTIAEVLLTKVTGFGILAVRRLTQAQYDAIPVPDPNTVYFITN